MTVRGWCRRWVRCPWCDTHEVRWVQVRGLTRRTCLACHKPYLVIGAGRDTHTTKVLFDGARVSVGESGYTAWRRRWR